MLCTRTATLLVLLALAPFSIEDEKIEFAPDEGTVLAKQFDLAVELDLVEMRVVESIGGRGRVHDSLDITFILERCVAFTDEYGPVVAGRPLSVERSFREMAARRALQTEENYLGYLGVYDREGSSDLEYETVLFTWDQDTEDWTVRIEGSRSDEDVAGLVEDTDARALLPPEPVPVRSSWDVPVEALRDLFLTPGEIDFLDGDGRDTGHVAMSALNRELTGEVETWFRSVRWIHGQRVAEIELLGKLEAEVEGDEIGASSYRVELELAAGSAFFWGLDANHLHSLELEAEVTVWQWHDLGGRHSEHRWEGTLTVAVTVDC